MLYSAVYQGLLLEQTPSANFSLTERANNSKSSGTCRTKVELKEAYSLYRKGKNAYLTYIDLTKVFSTNHCLHSFVTSPWCDDAASSFDTDCTV